MGDQEESAAERARSTAEMTRELLENRVAELTEERDEVFASTQAQRREVTQRLSHAQRALVRFRQSPYGIPWRCGRLDIHAEHRVIVHAKGERKPEERQCAGWTREELTGQDEEHGNEG